MEWANFSVGMLHWEGPHIFSLNKAGNMSNIWEGDQHSQHKFIQGTTLASSAVLWAKYQMYLCCCCSMLLAVSEMNLPVCLIAEAI
jgi:hypothetical protein